MNKMEALRGVNAMLFLSFFVQTLTVIIIFFRIQTPWTPAVFEIHEYNGLFMIVLVLTHLTLNWGWVRSTFFRKR